MWGLKWRRPVPLQHLSEPRRLPSSHPLMPLKRDRSSIYQVHLTDLSFAVVLPPDQSRPLFPTYTFGIQLATRVPRMVHSVCTLIGASCPAIGQTVQVYINKWTNKKMVLMGFHCLLPIEKVSNFWNNNKNIYILKTVVNSIVIILYFISFLIYFPILHFIFYNWYLFMNEKKFK